MTRSDGGPGPRRYVPRPARATVYRSPRRGPHALVLVALGVLLVGVLTGIVLGLQTLNEAEPVGSTRLAASASPSLPAPVSSAPPSSARPSSAPPSSAPPQPQQFSAIRGQGSGLCLDVQPDQPGAGGVVMILPCAGTPTQRWQRTATGMMVNGATGLCLTVAGAAADDRARVHQEACADAAHQRWRMTFDADGTGTFLAQHTGKCLDVQDGLVTPGIPVQQYVCNGSPAQRWFLQPVQTQPVRLCQPPDTSVCAGGTKV